MQADFVTPLSRFAQSLPTGCTTFIVAGSPCQQFTFAGRYRGQQGLCGPDSVLFFAVPTVAWILQELRPDTIVHVVLESAASMQAVHRTTIMQSLGGLNANEHLRALDSGAWSAFSTAPTLLHDLSRTREYHPSSKARRPLGTRMGPHSISCIMPGDVLPRQYQPKSVDHPVPCTVSGVQIRRERQ